jgi:uracil-DNA glycosylase family protein
LTLSADGKGSGIDASELIPERPTLPRLRDAAAGCRACGLWRLGTQTVFGAGRGRADVMLVGEQPGDQEDRAGKPFVGPAGKLLDRALDEAGIDRADAYVTNAVKHFKWKAGRGKRRLHQKPDAAEVRACRPWLEAELAVIRPKLLVLMGATAAQSLLGPSFRVTRERGRLLESDLAPLVTATIHPSAILRADPEERDDAMAALVDDLRGAWQALARL